MKTFLLITVLALIPLSGICQKTFRPEVPPANRRMVTFRFVPGKDDFYVPWNNNGAELERLYNLVDEFRYEIANGQVPIYVESYCASMKETRENIRIAHIRANRVKSELIVNKGMVEENFRTRNYASSYRAYRDIVVVTLYVPLRIEQPYIEQPRETHQWEPVRQEPPQQPPTAPQQPETPPAQEKPVAVVQPPVQPPVQPQQQPAAVVQRRTYAVAIRTNLLYDAFLQPTLGIEWRVNPHFGIKIDGSYSHWGSAGKDVQKIWFANPELRWYMGARKNFYLGAGGNYGRYNTYGFLIGNFWPEDTGYQGTLWNAGLTLGYQLSLSNSFALDFNLGVGYNSLEYDSFNLIEGVRVYKQKKKTTEMFAPTQAGINLVWTIW